MAKMKVHELAKELDITSKEVLAFLQEKGIEAKAAQSSVEEEAVESVRKAFSKKGETHLTDKKVTEAETKEVTKETAEAIQEEKKLLRTQVRQIITQRFLPLREEISRGICRCVLADTLYEKAKTVFLFVGTEREVDTLPILDHAWRSGKTVCVPRCMEGNRMALCRITSLDDLQIGSYGILEPKEACPTLPHGEIDFALIPCLACTRTGDRLGKGGGYYDRFFELYDGPAAVVCPEMLILDHIPLEPFDKRISYVITELHVTP